MKTYDFEIDVRFSVPDLIAQLYSTTRLTSFIHWDIYPPMVCHAGVSDFFCGGRGGAIDVDDQDIVVCAFSANLGCCSFGGRRRYVTTELWGSLTVKRGATVVPLPQPI